MMLCIFALLCFAVACDNAESAPPTNEISESSDAYTEFESLDEFLSDQQTVEKKLAEGALFDRNSTNRAAKNAVLYTSPYLLETYPLIRVEINQYNLAYLFGEEDDPYPIAFVWHHGSSRPSYSEDDYDSAAIRTWELEDNGITYYVQESRILNDGTTMNVFWMFDGEPFMASVPPDFTDEQILKMGEIVDLNSLDISAIER